MISNADSLYNSNGNKVGLNLSRIKLGVFELPIYQLNDGTNLELDPIQNMFFLSDEIIGYPSGGDSNNEYHK